MQNTYLFRKQSVSSDSTRPAETPVSAPPSLQTEQNPQIREHSPFNQTETTKSTGREKEKQCSN